MKGDIKLPSDLKFGIFFAFVFTALSFGSYYKEKVIFTSFFSTLAFVFFIISLIRPPLLHPLNRLWMKFGFLLNKIVSPIIMAILFFGLFSPIAILMKLAGRDELQLKKSKNNTFWKRREPVDYSGYFKNQF